MNIILLIYDTKSYPNKFQPKQTSEGLRLSFVTPKQDKMNLSIPFGKWIQGKKKKKLEKQNKRKCGAFYGRYGKEFLSKWIKYIFK